MDRWIGGGIILVGLMAIAVFGAPQHTVGRDEPQLAQVNNEPVRRYVYKNNTRETAGGEGELFAYPEDPSNIESKQNARNRTPVYIPNRCQKNEILYPGDQEADWVCDCKPTFVYHPPTRQCYQLFTKGYCEGNLMLIHRKDAKHPECVLNRCHRQDRDMVEFEQECVELNQYHAKCSHHQLKQLVGVREDTNELGCVNISDVPGKYSHPGNSTMANASRLRRS